MLGLAPKPQGYLARVATESGAPHWLRWREFLNNPVSQQARSEQEEFCEEQNKLLFAVP